MASQPSQPCELSDRLACWRLSRTADLLSIHQEKNRIKNPNLPTPVKTNQLKHELEGYEAAKYLLDGFTDGFRLGCLVPPKANIAKNHKYVYDHPEVIKKHITKGVALGRIAGPFTKPPFENFISFPLGIVPKSEPGKYRIIHDLSYPKNASVNTGVPREMPRFIMTP